MSAIVGVVFTGDSLTFAGISYAYQWAGVDGATLYSESDVPRAGFRAYPAAGVIMANWGLSGWTIANLETQAAALDALICNGCPGGGGRPLRKYVLVVRIGTNPASSDPVATAARVRTYCLARQAAGWNVIICPLTSRNDNTIANFDTSYAQPYNAIIAGWGASDGVAGVVSSADSVMYGTSAATNQTTYFNADKIHPLVAGHTRLKNDLAAVLNPLIEELQA